MIEANPIHARGIGYSDAHLLASLLLDKGSSLWTRDGPLAAVAAELGLGVVAP
jgi:hypothetical protein